MPKSLRLTARVIVGVTGVTNPSLPTDFFRKSSTKWLAKVLLVGLGAASSGGCSLPLGSRGSHLTVGYARVSHDQRQVQTTIPGLDVRVGTGHDGMNLGWSTLVIAAPTTQGSAPVDTPANGGWRYEPPLGLARSDGASLRRLGWFYWNRPAPAADGCRFIAAGHAGLALGLSRQLKGLEAGFGRQTWILVPTNSSGAWTLFFQSGINGVTRLEEQTHSQPNP